jgi:hypothetical protein
MQCEPLAAAEERAESSPFIVEFFMVRGPGFLCMAYCGADAKWRDAFNNEELYGDIQVLH